MAEQAAVENQALDENVQAEGEVLVEEQEEKEENVFFIEDISVVKVAVIEMFFLTLYLTFHFGGAPIAAAVAATLGVLYTIITVLNMSRSNTRAEVTDRLIVLRHGVEITNKILLGDISSADIGKRNLVTLDTRNGNVKIGKVPKARELVKMINDKKPRKRRAIPAPPKK